MTTEQLTELGFSESHSRIKGIIYYHPSGICYIKASDTTMVDGYPNRTAIRYEQMQIIIEDAQARKKVKFPSVKPCAGCKKK